MSGQLTRRLIQFNFRRYSVPFSSGQNRSYSEAPDQKSPPSALAKPVQRVEKTGKPTSITLYGPVDVSCVSGLPEERLKDRLVRIYQTPKNAMQSGTANADRWEIEFNTQERWENPLMGWSSSGDPVSNIKLQFFSKEDAISYAEKNRFNYYVEPEKKDKPKVKSYGFNFSWNKRSRVSTK